MNAKGCCGCVSFLVFTLFVLVLIGMNVKQEEPKTTVSTAQKNQQKRQEQETKRKKLAEDKKKRENIAAQEKVEKAKQAKYQAAYEKFVRDITKMSGVVRVQEILPGESLRVEVTGDYSDYEAKKLAKTLYSYFVIMRLRYMKPDEAKGCFIHLYDDAGRHLADADGLLHFSM